MTLYKLSVSTQVNPEDWDKDVIRLNGNSLHTYTWSCYSAENNSATPLYFRLKDKSENIIAVSFGLLTEKKKGIRFFSSLSFGSMAAASIPDNTRVMAYEIHKYCKNNNIVVLSMNSFGTPCESDVIPEIGFSSSRRWEFVLDIGITEEELWEKLHSKKRNLIRKGQKEGLRVVNEKGLDKLLKFRQLAVDTYERKTRQGIPYPAPGENSIYNRMQKHLVDSGLGRLYLTYSDDQVVAGAFFVAFNKQVYYMLSSASDTGLKMAAPDLILWTSITDYQKEGCTLFNFGGLSEGELNGSPLEQSGLYHFKHRFSPQVYPCFKGKLILRPLHHRIYSFVKKLKSMT
ncbi:MAG: peptidoglycan bridge formation glycyltransferase FemA/FemB family protein [Desulfobacteraceae bacterium]|jgi:hypothetical protein